MTKPLLLERQDAIAIIAINDGEGLDNFSVGMNLKQLPEGIERMGSPDIQEGMMAFLEKRKPTFIK